MRRLPSLRALSAVGGQGQQLGGPPRYQYVDAGSTWPRKADRSGSRACTSTPARYQSSRVATAKPCRKSWIRGRHRGERGRSPAVRTSWPNLCRTQAGMSLVPVLETKKLGALGSGQSASRRRA